jgi:hypothetical protein
VQKHLSQAPEQNDWQEFKPLFGGGKIKLCDTLRAVTPFGGLSVLIEFFGRRATVCPRYFVGWRAPPLA